MPGAALIVLLVIGLPIAIVLWLVIRAFSARDEISGLSRRVRDLENEVARIKERGGSTPAMVPQAESAEPPPTPGPVPAIPILLDLRNQRPAVHEPPVIAPSTEPPPEPEIKFTPPPAPPRPRPAIPEPAKPAINWEQFMGVKGFAWIGGFALFLGVAFFIKYSFDRNLIPPALRAAVGFLTGLGLIGGGLMLARRNFPALSQTLCATGVVVLYAVTFACRALYHFPLFGPVPTFVLMAVVTTAAFFLAVRMDALVVAILGMLGGFLTPVLLSTGEDRPFALFGYLAFLDAGLILIALNRRWNFLTALAAAGTALMQFGWMGEFFDREKYYAAGKIFIPLGVLLGFNALYLAANWLAKCRARSNWPLIGANLGLAAMSLAWTAYFLCFEPLAQRPAVVFGFVFLIDLVVAALAWIEERTFPAQPLAGLAVFGLLGFWTASSLNNNLLYPALALYLVFAGFHSALPVYWQRKKGAAAGGAGNLGHFFPPLALILLLIPILHFELVPFVVWPVVLLVDGLAIALAVVTVTLLPVLLALVLTLGALDAMIDKIPVDLTGLPTGLFLICGFALFFAVISVCVVRRFRPAAFETGLTFTEELGDRDSIAALLPIGSVVLPFLLLILTTQRLPLANPSPVFGVALLLLLMVLGMARLFALEWLPVAGLICTAAVELAWRAGHYGVAPKNPIAPGMLMNWYLVFYAIVLVFPFVFLKKFSDKTGPWAAAALAGPAQFLLIYDLVRNAWPNHVMGLIPAAFAVPALLALQVIREKIPTSSKARINQLAWFGGVALLFITLIFPIQFHRQWLTIGWAVEGAALLWLFHRVPHDGLRVTGCALLLAAFVRLALNPAVLAYHPHGARPLLNWYLYSYGIVTAALFVGARLLAPPRHRLADLNARAFLGALGTVLTFLLLNIEIADYFSPAGAVLTFQFSGNFARDMTYSIAWALFALGLLVFGIGRKIAGARYAAMGLLCVTILKLFFHDLAMLGQLYRIGAFIGVAFIAMLASFAYQKFYSANAKAAESVPTRESRG